MKIQKLSSVSPRFPAKLKEIPQPPKQLYVLGNIEPLVTMPAIAVVGSRKVTAYGKQVTHEVVSDLVRSNCAIISGLALGVDALAHEATLEAGGYTVAVMPCGLDTIYPSSHFMLAKQIIERGGALISEYPSGMKTHKSNFIARNRLVSGLCDGLLITEAAAKSGTMHTANFALDQGKTVMAVPGNVYSPLSEGTNNVIRAGAHLVTGATDIMDALGLDTPAEQVSLLGSTEEEALLLELLGSGVSDGADLLIKSNLSAVSFNQTLTMLEISGRIRPLGAGHWALKR